MNNVFQNGIKTSFCGKLRGIAALFTHDIQ